MTTKMTFNEFVARWYGYSEPGSIDMMEIDEDEYYDLEAEYSGYCQDHGFKEEY